MKVILDNSEIIVLGETEATPTIGFKDYSRRETDAFGVTTVVERDFARRMALKLIVPFDQASALQRKLADLRATAAQWVADERFDWLNFRGFYKDFEIDLSVPPISYCTLTVEGVAAGEAIVDDGRDPAPQDMASTLRLLQPAIINDDSLLASNVPENDHPEWSAALSYPLGARVIESATHRIYESAASNNTGNDPTGASGFWTDIGATNRWAMFDQALGSLTKNTGSFAVTIQTEAINAIALLDVTAASVRVQIGGSYDQTETVSEDGSALFLDIPQTSESAVVTITGSGQVSVGTLLIGKLVGLGLTEDSAKASITDYSRREEDEFGEVEIVKRSWAKRIGLRSVLQTTDLDTVANRIAAVRARPALWIGADGIDALMAYGFCSDFSIAVDTTISRLSLTIEGLSTAGKIEPLGAHIDWPDIADPTGTKPADNADVTGDNTALDTTHVNGVPSATVLQQITDAQQTISDIDDLTTGIIQNATTLAEEVKRIEIGGNLLSNTDFSSGLENWSLVTSTPGAFNWDVDSADFTITDEHYQGLLCLQPNGDLSAAIISDWVPITPESWIQISAWLASRECSNLLRLQWADADRNYMSDAAESEEVYHPWRGGSAPEADFKRVWCKAHAPAVARYARLVAAKGPFLSNPAGDLSWLFLLRPMLAVASASQSEPSSYSKGGGGSGPGSPNASLVQVQTAAIRAEAAAAQRIDTLAANVAGQGARLTTTEQVAATAFDRVTGARWSKEAIAGNGRAQLTVYAYDNDGDLMSGVDIIGDLTLSGNLLVNGTIQTAKMIENAVSAGGTAKATSIGLTSSTTYSTIASLSVAPYSAQSVYLVFASVRGRAVHTVSGIPTPIPFQIEVTNTSNIDVNTNVDTTNQYSAVTTIIDVVTGLTAATTFSLRGRANIGNASAIATINNAVLMVLELKR